MKDQDLQKVMLMMCALVFFLAPALPFASFCLAMFLWPGVLAFDRLDNRGRTDMVMPDE